MTLHNRMTVIVAMMMALSLTPFVEAIQVQAITGEVGQSPSSEKDEERSDTFEVLGEEEVIPLVLIKTYLRDGIFSMKGGASLDTKIENLNVLINLYDEEIKKIKPKNKKPRAILQDKHKLLRDITETDMESIHKKIEKKIKKYVEILGKDLLTQDDGSEDEGGSEEEIKNDISGDISVTISDYVIDLVKQVDHVILKNGKGFYLSEIGRTLKDKIELKEKGVSLEKKEKELLTSLAADGLMLALVYLADYKSDYENRYNIIEPKRLRSHRQYNDMI